MNAKPRRPNHLLRYARQEQGWSQQRVAEQIGTTEDVISRWERGTRVPSPFYRERLCQLFQKSAHDLGFLHIPPVEFYHHISKPAAGVSGKRRIMAYLEPFVFGDISSTWIVIDGDGTYQYAPQNIVTHFEMVSEELPAELQERKRQIAQMQVHNRSRGLPFHWNGQRYSFDRFVVSRESSDESLALDLWFTPSDYHTFLATNMSLDDPTLRRQYLATADWSQPVPFFSHSFGVYLTVLTTDNKVLLTYRSKSVGSRPGEYNVSVCEGLGVADAAGKTTNAPDIYSCAERGLVEELGLRRDDDWRPELLHFLSFGVDSWYAQWGLLGTVKVRKTARDILNYQKAGVKDKLENAQIHLVDFTPEAIVEFAQAHQPWTPGGLTCLYHGLVHEFGRASIEQAMQPL
ncbi:MAG TPA: helix-turn-helix transcriptional regulator [Ktedonobacteraceae bacterium]|nr:helix-turn-helix transcriptional regulator [Ktedonobacteraceae bacterium]